MTNISARIEISDPQMVNLLASAIVDEMERRDLVTRSKDSDSLIEVSDIRHRLGRRGRPMAHQTFKVNFLDTGLLEFVDAAQTPNKKKRYVLRSRAEQVISNIINQKPLPVLSI